MTYLALTDAILLILSLSIASYFLTGVFRTQQRVEGSHQSHNVPPCFVGTKSADEQGVILTQTAANSEPKRRPQPQIVSEDSSQDLPPILTTESSSSMTSRQSVRASTGNRSHTGPVCFRISGIPLDWSSVDIENALKNLDPELEMKNAELSGPFPASSDLSQCMLLNLDFCTAYFTFTDPNQVKYYTVIEEGKRSRLVIDKHFYDLTPMNNPETPIVADVIAITGLGGHAFGSWRSRSLESRPIHRPMWIRDYLPRRFPKARIMTYGYDSSLINPNRARMTDYRRNFTECLHNARRNCSGRPIIFIGHSMGGLLVIQLLVEWSQDRKQHALRDCISGIFLFGTPHQGMATLDLSALVDDETNGSKVRDLLAQLKEGSEFLENQKESLSKVWVDFKGKIFSFYESEPTNSVKKLGPGQFERAGTPVQMVHHFSAQLFLPNEFRYSIQANHTDMVKLNSPEDRAFQTVVTGIERCLEIPDPESMINRLTYLVKQDNDVNFADQTKYLEEYFEPDCLESSRGYIWFFRHMDYEAWYKGVKEYQLLVVGGHPGLRHIASHCTRTLGNGDNSCLVLCFFYSSLISMSPRVSGGKDTRVVWTLFRQILDAYTQDEQQSLFKLFFRKLVSSMDLALRKKVVSGSNLTPERILDLSCPTALWLALGVVLGEAIGQSKNCQLNKTTPERKYSLALIFDLHGLDRTECLALIANIRSIIEYLRKYSSIVRVLLTDPPVTVTRDLQLQSSEVYIIYDKERQDCLRTLNLSNSQYEKTLSRHENTFDWLWNTVEYVAWNSFHRSDPGVLLIEGKPGSGKSTLIRYFKDHFDPACDNDNVIIASFFYSAQDGESGRSHGNMLRALSHQILKQDETFFIHFQRKYREHIKKPIEWSPEHLIEILRACKKHPLPRILYFIIDAMDESDSAERPEMVEFLQGLSNTTTDNAGSKIKIILTSRPINEFQDEHYTGRLRILLQERNRNDIKIYTDARLKNIVFHSYGDIKEQIEQYILNHSNGVFLWVHLVMNELVRSARSGSNQTTLLEFLRSLPKSLESFFAIMLKGLQDHDPQDKKDGKRILQFCLFSHVNRAVELPELYNALAISGQAEEPEPDLQSWRSGQPGDILKRVTYCVGGFVDIIHKNRSIVVAQIMHQTVREFFLRPHESVVGSSLDVTNSEDATAMIGLTCVRFLEIINKEMTNIASLPGTMLNPQHNTTIVEYLNGRAFLKFALEYLAYNRESIPPKTSEKLLNLVAAIRENPLSITNMLLTRLAEPQGGDTFSEKINRLLLLSAEMGYATAVGNLLAMRAEIECLNIENQTPLRLAARGGHCSVADILLGSHASINSKDRCAMTALHLATQNGQGDMVDWLLACGANIESSDLCGLRALHFAAIAGDNRMVERLLIGSASIDAHDSSNYSALDLAVLYGHVTTYELLAKTTSTEELEWGKASSALFPALGDFRVEKFEPGLSPLHIASLYGHVSMIAFLVNRGISVDIRSSIGSTPLHLAAQNGFKDICDILLRLGAEINAVDRGRSTALHLGAQNGYGAICEMLLARGVDINCQDQGGCTALHLASQNRHVLVSQILVAHGAEDNVQDRLEGSTALHLAAAPGDRSDIRQGTDSNTQDQGGTTALHLVAKNAPHKPSHILQTQGANYNGRDQVALATPHQAEGGGYVDDLCSNRLAQGVDINACDEAASMALHQAARIGDMEACEILIAQGADVNAPDQDQSTPLHLGARYGNLEVCGILLAHGADLKACDRHQSTPLHLAARYGHMGAYYILLAKGTDVNACDQGQYTPLHLAARYGDVEACDILLAHGADLKACDRHQSTPLHLAARYGHVEACGILLAKGADLKACNQDRSTPLHLAARYGRVKVCSILLAHGADLNACDQDQSTPLHLAARYGHGEMCYTLLASGADANTSDLRQYTALHLAAHNGDVVVCKSLLNWGADVNACDEAVSTALHRAARNGHLKACDILLAHGADVNACDQDQSTPRYLAARYGHREIYEILLASGADANTSDFHQYTALHLAAHNGDLDACNSLLKWGADVKACDEEASTPLHQAARNGHLKACDILLAHGADVNACDQNQSTPLYLAARYGHREIYEILLASGADANTSDFHQYTALHLAAHNGDLDACNSLLKWGADVKACDEEASTPLHQAARNGHLKACKTLLAHGANLNVHNQTGLTPLHLVSQYGHTNACVYFIEAGAYVNARDESGSTALHLAAQYGNDHICDLLLSVTDLVNAFTDVGLTPLHLAAQHGHLGICGVLLAAGGNPRLQAQDGCTALDLAARNGREDVLRVLPKDKVDLSILDNPGATALDLLPDISSIMKNEGHIDGLHIERRTHAAPVWRDSSTSEVQTISNINSGLEPITPGAWRRWSSRSVKASRGGSKGI